MENNKAWVHDCGGVMKGLIRILSKNG